MTASEESARGAVALWKLRPEGVTSLCPLWLNFDNTIKSKRRVIMSQHASLRSGNKMKAKRSVLSRYERIEILKQKGKWKEGDSVYGLAKTKHID